MVGSPPRPPARGEFIHRRETMSAGKSLDSGFNSKEKLKQSPEGPRCEELATSTETSTQVQPLMPNLEGTWQPRYEPSLHEGETRAPMPALP